MISWVIEAAGAPLVVDADGLNALPEIPDWRQRIARPTVVTPHPGEMGRLLGISPADVQADRQRAALELFKTAPAGRLVVVLKGAETIVTDGKRLFTNDTGNPGMATGGTGDVLTGVLTGLLAQGMHPFDAAVLAVHLHGMAGDMARDQQGEIAMTAADVVDALPEALSQLSG